MELSELTSHESFKIWFIGIPVSYIVIAGMFRACDVMKAPLAKGTRGNKTLNT
jgi:hypothetical protein